jgi:hypothetical protein
MLLPCFPASSRLVLLVGVLFGFWLPHVAVQSHSFLPQTVLQENFDPPGEPTPPDTVGAGSRGVVQTPPHTFF